MNDMPRVIMLRWIGRDLVLIHNPQEILVRGGQSGHEY